MRNTWYRGHNSFWLTSAILVFLISDAALAANGKIAGRVVDSKSGEGIVGATVIVDSQWIAGKPVRLSVPLGAMSDANGYYTILNIHPGTYNVTARMLGYASMVQKEVTVEAERTITVNFSLEQGAIQMRGVEVVYRANIIRPDIAGTQEIVHTQRVEEAPMTRVDEFIGKLAGVELVDNSQGHGLSIRGGAIRETDVSLDGISLQDPRSENSYLSFNSTTIQELQVMTGGFQAKYGGIQSGLVNAVTKDGSRQRYSLAVTANMTAGGQQKFFGQNPWSSNSVIYQIFAGKYAMRGIRTHADSMAVPSEFWGFKGWANGVKQGSVYRYMTGQYTAPYIQFPAGFTAATQLDSTQRMEIWKLRHPTSAVATKPDYYFEGSLTGPVPGENLPLLGWYLGRTTFLLGYKYENTQFAYPIGPRDNYIDWNTQLKLTTDLTSADKLTVEGLYAYVNTLNTGIGSTYGGSLQEGSSSFGFLTNTQSSIEQQARLIGGGSFQQIYDISRMQFYDQRFVISGAKYTHTISPNAYFTLDAHFQYNDHNLQPYSLDTSKTSAWWYMVGDKVYDTPQPGAIKILKVPSGGTPNGSTNYIPDELSMFNLSGGPQRIDSSFSWFGQLNGNLVWQVDRHNQLEAGFSAELTRLFDYAGTWYQVKLSYTPDLWQYYDVMPITGGAYIQDKLEFQGIIANLGVRLDYWNPRRNAFAVSNPPDPAYTSFYNDVYANLPGGFGSYQTWALYRSMLGNPPGWPSTPNKVQMPISPRLSVSFPVTESSKMYFNYGHFYQRPAFPFVYDLAMYPAAATIPSPDLSMGKTVSYEFGFEQTIMDEYLATVSFYYKNQTNQPLPITYVDYYHQNQVTMYVPAGYDDIDGVEFRLEKTMGRFVTFWANYDYMMSGSGQNGLRYIYQNQLEAANAMRSANITTIIPTPRAHVDLNFHTPMDLGPSGLGVSPLGGWNLDFLFDWQAGGKMLFNPQEPDIKKQEWLSVVDYTNLDIRLSKMFTVSKTNFELVLTVQNALNEKRLYTDNMTPNQLTSYENSLHLPWNSGAMKGNDKWGDIPSSKKPYIDVGWWQAPIFFDPRRILLGIRFNL